MRKKTTPSTESGVKCAGVPGRQAPSTGKRGTKQGRGERWTTHFSYFYFMNTAEDPVPMLVLKFSHSGRPAATALPAKGVTDYGQRFFTRFIKETGVRRFINFSDNEHAMVALKDAAAQACEGVEYTPQACPQGVHQANGQIENTVRELKRQMRALRLHLEKKLRQYNPNGGFKKLEDTDPVLFWTPEFAANAIAWYRKGPDGKTPYEREFGRK